jgi:hypothetical protein
VFSTVRHAADALIDDVYLVGLAEEADGSGAGLIFQEPVDPDLVDEIDTYCVTNEVHAVMYGGVREVTFQDSVLTVVLDPDLSSDAGLPSRFVLALRIPDEELTTLLAGLRRVLAYGRADQLPQLQL